MSKTYIAKHDGKIVGKRTTKDRTYTHAVVVIPSVEYHRQKAYCYHFTSTDRSNYEYYCAQAEGRSKWPATPDAQVRASMLIDGGFAAYVARIRDQYIEQFELDLANGKFEPGVASWAGRPDLALKAAAQCRQPWNEAVEIVPAELVVKKSKVA
jgi:hypothetical protein